VEVEGVSGKYNQVPAEKGGADPQQINDRILSRQVPVTEDFLLHSRNQNRKNETPRKNGIPKKPQINKKGNCGCETGYLPMHGHKREYFRGGEKVMGKSGRGTTGLTKARLSEMFRKRKRVRKLEQMGHKL